MTSQHNTSENELREQTRRSIARLISIQRGDDTWSEDDYITAGNILFVCSSYIKHKLTSYTKERERLARIDQTNKLHSEHLKRWDDDECDIFKEAIAELEKEAQ